MNRRANSSRERILSTAEAMILERGFVGTTIEDIIDKAAITKGGFFYHFEGKRELAKALVVRYIDNDDAMFAELSERADSLSEDPLQRLLIFLNLLTEMVAGLTSIHPGCLVAAFTYESQQFDDEIRNMVEKGMLSWREMIERRLEEVIEQYPPVTDVSIPALADMFCSSLEGGILLARIYGSNTVLIEQMHAYRMHLRLLFNDIRKQTPAIA